MYLKIVKCVYKNVPYLYNFFNVGIKNSFFSTSAMQLGRQLYTISGSTCYSPPRWAANFSRRYVLGLTRKWTLRNNKWDVIIITGQLLCTKHVISLKNILFLEFENFNFITCCARNISLEFNVIQLYFEIIFNLTRNFGYKYFGSHQNVGIFFEFYFERLFEIINRCPS